MIDLEDQIKIEVIGIINIKTKMIKVQNIIKEYKDEDKLGNVINSYLALDDISFSINDGEFVAIMGPSGSGKSTLMHILGALDTPTSGKYYLDNRDVSQMTDNELAEIRNRKIGFVFQSFNLLPRASVLRNVGLPLVYSNIPSRDREGIIRKCLADAQLDPKYFNHLSNQLSGGQIQRVAIARSLVMDPSIILADEPTGNLDSKTGDLILKQFRQLNRDLKKTIILITHERDIANYADRLIIIRDGKIVEDKINSNPTQI